MRPKLTLLPLLAVALLAGCGDDATSTSSTTTSTTTEASAPPEQTTVGGEQTQTDCEKLPDDYVSSNYGVKGATSVKSAKVKSTATSNNPPILSDGFYFVSGKLDNGDVATFLETTRGSAFAIDDVARSVSVQGVDTPLPDISPQTPGYQESRDCVS